MAVTRKTRTQQNNETGSLSLASSETVWMEGLDRALDEFKRMNPDVDIHGIHSVSIVNGEWNVGLRCGSAGVSFARIVLDYGYHLEWVSA